MILHIMQKTVKNLALTMLGMVFTTIASPAFSQTKYLPEAGFQIRSNPSEKALPNAAGLHLTPGLSRTPSESSEIYNPGEPSLNMALVRWEKQKMPLLIWISPGLKFPEVPFSEIQATRVDMVFALLQQEHLFSNLTVAPGWSEEINDLVASGFEEWREFESEGLISFGFTDDPKKAHILVFFTDVFKDSSEPGGINVGGITSAQVYPLAQAQQIKIAQKPVIIELSTVINSTPERMRGAAAHEFGHALGIKAHSPYREDLMYVDRIVNELSPSDKATLRYLYHQTPAYVM